MEKAKKNFLKIIKSNLNLIYDADQVDINLYSKKIKTIISDFNSSHKSKKEFDWSKSEVKEINKIAKRRSRRRRRRRRWRRRRKRQR